MKQTIYTKLAHAVNARDLTTNEQDRQKWAKEVKRLNRKIR